MQSHGRHRIRASIEVWEPIHQPTARTGREPIFHNTGEAVDENIQQLIDIRNKARAEKDWSKADEVRDKLDKMGIILEDTTEGTIWKKR